MMVDGKLMALNVDCIFWWGGYGNKVNQLKTSSQSISSSHKYFYLRIKLIRFDNII